jgi:DNA-binding beta-propeller fold protein YncE
MKRINFIIIVSVISLAALGQVEKIKFEAPLAYPEGVAWNPANNMFYVSSVRTGTIGSVDPSGKYKEIYKDSSLRSSYGMKVNAAGTRLWICIGDANYSKYSTPATFQKMARIISLDLNTGKKIADIDLTSLWTGKHFANDLSIDNNNNIYITDSFSPVIYRIDANGKATILTSGDMFKSEEVGLNGIAWHPQGFLLVAHNTDGVLYKIDLKNPKNIAKVRVQSFFPGADGLLWADNNNLVLIQNKGVNKAFRLSSNDNWVTATVNASTLAEDRMQNPTTATMQQGKVWVLNAKLNELSDSSATPSKEFSLQQVKFVPTK